VELLYGDHEGGQRAITRFTALLPPGGTQPDGTEPDGTEPDTEPDREKAWITSMSRHWNVDRPEPR
jgi:hypothetical protein